MVEFAVLDARAGGHVLNLAGPDDAAIAHRVLVFERAAQNVSDDFHVAVRMRAKAAAARDDVVIDDAKRAESHVLRVVIIRKRKCEMRIQPAVVDVAAFPGFADGDHMCWMTSLVS